MKKYNLYMSKDAINIDAEHEIIAEKEPSYWECEEIAQAHNCEFWSLSEVETLPNDLPNFDDPWTAFFETD